MIREAAAIICGMEAAMEQVGASKGIIGIKDKNTEAIAAIQRS